MFHDRGGVTTLVPEVGDNGSDIDFKMKTGWIRVNPEGGQSRLNRVRLLFGTKAVDADLDWDVQLKIYGDFSTSAFYSDTETLGGGRGSDGNPHQLEFTGVGGKRFEWFQFEVSWSSGFGPWRQRLEEIELAVTHLDRRQGDTI